MPPTLRRLVCALAVPVTLALPPTGNASTAMTTPAWTEPKAVVLDSTNSVDITGTERGAARIREFSQGVQRRGVVSEPRSAQALVEKYRVISVDVADILPDSRCERGQETLILPRNTVEIRYMAGSPDPQGSGSPCMITVAWDDAPESAVQDDPKPSGKIRTAAAPYLEMYQGYCADRKTADDHWFQPCYKKYVTKYDGNPTWNYYAIEAYNTCVDTNTNTTLISCGRGAGVTSPASARWLDRSPGQDQHIGNCRSIPLSVSLGPLGLSVPSFMCDEQRIYIYPEAGKMSSYWKGESSNGTRETRHLASVKSGQDDGRPVWTNWFNAESCNVWTWPVC